MTSWTDLSNTSGKPSASAGTYGTLDALWFNNALYVFYVDGTDSKGRVVYYDETDGWMPAEKNGGAVTGTGISAVQLASSGNTLYAGYIEGGTAYTRILE